MVNILLCCNAGMSTSLFVEKTRSHIKDIGKEIYIEAIPLDQLDFRMNDQISLVALAPQIKFQKDKVESAISVPVMVIDMRDYGMMDVQKVLAEMITFIEENKK